MVVCLRVSDSFHFTVVYVANLLSGLTKMMFSVVGAKRRVQKASHTHEGCFSGRPRSHKSQAQDTCSYDVCDLPILN